MSEANDLVVGIVVEDSRLDLLEVQDQLFTDDVLDGWLRGAVVSGEGRESGIGAGTLGEEVLGSGLGAGGVLGDGRLDTLNGEPMG